MRKMRIIGNIRNAQREPQTKEDNKMNILNIIFEGGESRNHHGKACDYMLARVDGTRIYAERLVDDRWNANDEFDHYDELLAEIIDQAEEKGVNFNKVKVNGETISIKATFNIPSFYADYFDDAEVCADSLSELEEKLEKMQTAAEIKMRNARDAKELTAKAYVIAPTYASMARVEWVALF